MFSNEELKNLLVLTKAGVKSLDLDSNGMVVSAVLVKKLEDAIKEPAKVETPKTEEKTAVKPTRGTALVK